MVDLHLDLRRLVPADLEKAFLKLRREGEALEDRGRGKAAIIDIDLSAVQWIDIGAAAQLIIQIDGWSDAATKIVVRLPSLALQKADISEHDRQLRVSAARFLKYVRFKEALESLAKRRRFELTFLLDGQAVTAWGHEGDFPAAYLRVLPLNWIGLPDGSSRERLAKHLTDALKNSGEGIRTPDAQALANVVLFELVQNVVEHSHSGEAALVCGFAHADTSAIADYFASEERPYLLAAHEAQQPILEVIVADGGRGISQTLEAAYKAGPGLRDGNLTRNGKALAHNIIRWSFDRWSTEKPASARGRGVRGLFRVDRLVAKYFGQISVRTAESLFVREHQAHAGLAERFNTAPKKFAHQFGTLIRIRMTGTSLPGMDYLATRQPAEEDLVVLPQLVGNGEAKILAAQQLVEAGFTPDFEAEVVEAINGAQERPDALYVTLMSEAPEEEGQRSLESALRFLCAHAGPVPIHAIGVKCSWDEFELTTKFINDACAEVSPDSDGAASQSERLDPVMAVHQSGAIRWIGLPPQLVDLVGKATPGQRIKVPAGKFEEVLRLKTRIEHVFAIDKDATAPRELTLVCRADLKPYLARVDAQLKTRLKDVEIRPDKNGAKPGVFLTPTLSFVDRWYRLDGFLDGLDEAFANELAFGMASVVTESFRLKLGSPEPDLAGTMVFKEGRSSGRMCHLVTTNLGFIAFESAGTSASSFGSTKQAPVIVYTDVVRSGESLRRAAQTVLRKGFTVAAIVAMVDMRKNTNAPIEAFGQKFDLVTLIQLDSEAPPSEVFSVLSPILQRAEVKRATTKNITEEFNRRLDSEAYVWSALKFGHSVKANGRHLTLTLDAQALLRTPEFIDQARVALTSNPLFSQYATPTSKTLVLGVADGGDAIWAASVRKFWSALRLSSPLEVDFVRRVSLGAGQEIIVLPRVKTKIAAADLVILFDWGVISGKTIDALTAEAVNSGAKRVIALVGNSQLGDAEHAFRASVLKINRQRQFHENLFDPPEVTEEEVEYRFQSLSKIPLGHHTESECPVCRQVDDLRQIACPDHFLAEYSATSSSALITTEGAPFLDSFDSSPRIATWIEELASFRALLVASQTSTAARFTFAKRIDSVAHKCKSDAKLSPAAFALVELLYVEGNWLQLPPVRYKRCKEPLKAIVLRVIEVANKHIQPRAIAVLRRLSKTDFIRVAPEIFRKLGDRPDSQKALLFGIHTYIARRYHETLGMLDPAIATLTAVNGYASADGNTQNPKFAPAYLTIKYLKFQASFLRSRTESKGLDLVRASHELRDLFSNTNYPAHGLQNQAVENLRSSAFLKEIKKRFEQELEGEIVNFGELPSLKTLLQTRIASWELIHDFLVLQVIPRANAAKSIFESKDFEDFVKDEKARWLRNLLERHREGLAPELVSERFLRALQRVLDGTADRPQARAMLELLAGYEEEVANLDELILRAERLPETGGVGRAGVEPCQLRKYLDSSYANVAQLINSAVEEARLKDDTSIEVQGLDTPEIIDAVVLCRRFQLQEAIKETIKNAARHGLIEKDNRVGVVISCSLTSDVFTILFTNKINQMGGEPVQIDPASPHRHGIGLFKHVLNAFEGDFVPNEATEEFKAKLMIKRWPA